MHLAHGEGVELEGQLRRRIGIWLLLARQLDVEADRRRADVGGAAVGRLHDSGTAAGRNDVVALTVDGSKRASALGQDAAKATRFVIPVRHARRRWSAAAVAICLADAALPRTTMVVRTPHERSRSSALANSRRKRTPCMESLRMKSGSDAGRR